MNETTEPFAITPDAMFRLKLKRLVHKLLPASMYFVAAILEKEIDKASPQMLSQLRREIMEILV